MKNSKNNTEKSLIHTFYFPKNGLLLNSSKFFVALFSTRVTLLWEKSLQLDLFSTASSLFRNSRWYDPILFICLICGKWQILKKLIEWHVFHYNKWLQHTRPNAAKEERFAKSTLQIVSTTNISYILYDDDGTKCLLSVQLFVMSSRIYKHILNGVWSEGFS